MAGKWAVDALLGQWGRTEHGVPWLNFVDDGSVHGSDGCNRLMGRYQVHGEKVEFGMLASTMMYCEGVDEWLGAASYAVQAEGQLELFNAQDAKIGVLERS